MKCLIFISCELSDLACLVTNISIGQVKSDGLDLKQPIKP